MAVEILARAAPGEVLVSRTVADLVAGASIGFADRGSHVLAAVGDSWQLLATSAGSTSSPPARDQPAMLFRREGEYWTVAFGGKLVRMRDAKGLGYLARLLRHPHHEFHVLDLLVGGAPRAEADAREDGLTASTPDAGVVLDEPPSTPTGSESPSWRRRSKRRGVGMTQSAPRAPRTSSTR